MNFRSLFCYALFETCLFLTCTGFSGSDTLRFEDILFEMVNWKDSGYSTARRLLSASQSLDNQDALYGYYMLGCYYDLKHDPISISYYDSARHLAESLSEPEKLSNVLLQIGYVYKNTIHSRDSAQLFFQSSLDYAEKSKYLNGIIESSTGLAFLRMDQGDYVGAMNYFLNIQPIADSLDLFAYQISILTNIGHIYMRLGLNANALTYFSAAHDVTQGQELKEYTTGQYYSLLAMVEANLKLNEMEEADRLLQKADTIKKYATIKLEEYYPNHLRGQLYLQKREYGKALKHFEGAYDPDDLYLIDHITSYVGQAEAYLQLGDTLNSHRLLMKALSFNEQYGPLPLYESLNFYQALANSFSLQNEYGQANTYLNKYITNYKKLYSELVVGQFLTKEIEKKVSLEQKQAQLERALMSQQLVNKRQESYLLGFLLTLVLLVLSFVMYRSRKRNKYLAELAALNGKLTETIGQLQNTQEQLVQEKKMSAVGTLAMGLAHEINNPLNFIKGSLKFIGEFLTNLKEKGNEEALTYLSYSKQGVKRINSVVKSVNAISGKVINQVESFNLAELIDHSLRLLAFEIPKSIHVEVKSKDLEICGYRDSMIQILTSVISNSVEAIDKKSDKSGNNFIKIHVSALNKPDYPNHVEIKIVNSGVPMEVEDYRKLFDPFYTDKDPGQGMGLGLTAAYFNANASQGEIRMRNVDGGVETLIILPISLETECQESDRKQNV